MDYFALGFVVLPPGALIRLIPNEPCESVFVKLRLLPKREEEPTLPPDVESGFVFAVDRVCNNLGTGPDCWRWSLHQWLPPTGSPV
jgi:P-type Ca2+ transporter type 2C